MGLTQIRVWEKLSQWNLCKVDWIEIYETGAPKKLAGAALISIRVSTTRSYGPILQVNQWTFIGTSLAFCKDGKQDQYWLVKQVPELSVCNLWFLIMRFNWVQLLQVTPEAVIALLAVFSATMTRCINSSPSYRTQKLTQCGIYSKPLFFIKCNMYIILQ